MPTPPPPPPPQEEGTVVTAAAAAEVVPPPPPILPVHHPHPHPHHHNCYYGYDCIGIGIGIGGCYDAYTYYDQHYIQPFRDRVGRIVNHPTVQGCMILAIAINALMLGLETCAFVQTDASLQSIFSTTDDIFLLLFTTELFLQWITVGTVPLLRNPWLLFDLILIVASWVFQDFTIIRSFRIVRALRLITRIRVMRDLITALFAVLPRMCAIFVLLTLISYIFAVLMTQLWHGLYATGATGNVDYFGRIDATFFTLFQMMTLDGWAAIARQVMLVHSYAWIPIILYVIITGFVVVNLVIAVICDAVSALQDDDKAKLHGSYDAQRFHVATAAVMTAAATTRRTTTTRPTTGSGNATTTTTTTTTTTGHATADMTEGDTTTTTTTLHERPHHPPPPLTSHCAHDNDEDDVMMGVVVQSSPPPPVEGVDEEEESGVVAQSQNIPDTIILLEQLSTLEGQVQDLLHMQEATLRHIASYTLTQLETTT
jgi:hypothetical protein